MSKVRKLYLDQYGYRYYARTRKELVEQVSPYRSPRVAIMYRDKRDGSTVRCGYVISHYWCSAFIPDEQPA